MFTALESSGLYRMRLCDQGYSDWVRELVLQEDVQLLDTTALELMCVIEWARCRLKMFRELARRMCEHLEISHVSDDDMSSDEECLVMASPSAGLCCSELDSEMNSQRCGAR